MDSTFGSHDSSCNDNQTNVVNVKRTDEWDVKIGRSTRFGNPYVLEQFGGDYTREASVEQFRLYFAHKIGTSKDFRQAVQDLKGKTLGCYCKPKLCHGDVIVEYLEDRQ